MFRRQIGGTPLLVISGDHTMLINSRFFDRLFPFYNFGSGSKGHVEAFDLAYIVHVEINADWPFRTSVKSPSSVRGPSCES